MKKQFSILLCLLLLCVPARLVFSQNMEEHDFDNSAFADAEETNEYGGSPPSGSLVVNGLIGAAETLFTNGLILSYNLVYSNLRGSAGWATPNAYAIQRNFTEPWSWERTDGFKVNQIGHPIQGSMYFSAGRVNGFSFYGSTFFSLLGSFTWEALCESNHASINDFITTVTGSISVGEMLYRLYLEACAAGVPAPLAAIINPMAGFHRLVTGWKPPDYGRKLRQFQTYIGTGFTQTHFSLSGGSQEMFAFNGFIGDFGFSIIYGDPFVQESRTPFEHFEFAMSVGLDAGNYFDIRLISNGYLFSFTPVYTDTDMMSTGLSLHVDFVSLGKFDMYDATIDQSGNALDWTIKYQHLFSENVVFQAKLHAGVTFMGVSDFFAPDGSEVKTLKNYGGGFNSKLFLALEHNKLGRLSANLFCYTLWTYPETSDVSQGSVSWLFADITYSHPVSKHLSLGIMDSFALERGIFSGFPDTRKYNNMVKLFITWDF